MPQVRKEFFLIRDNIFKDTGTKIEDILPDYKPTKTKEEKEVKPITKQLKRRIDL